MMKNGIIACALAVLLSGCFGSFNLTKNVYEANDGVSENGFVKSVAMVGMFIIPIYEIAAITDLLIFNSLEFWTGENPISMKEGEHRRQVIHADEGSYQLDATKNRITISDLQDDTGEGYVLVFDEGQGHWLLSH